MENNEVTEYIAQFNTIKQERINTIRTIIHIGIPEIQEKMWTKVPKFYTDKTNIVIRVFDDHINFISDSVVEFREELSEYNITPKGMLQIFDNQELPIDTIKKIISECES